MFRQWPVAVMLAATLMACGGGGDGQSSSISASTTSVTATSPANGYVPAEVVQLTLTNPRGDIYAGAEHTNNAIASVQMYSTTATDGLLEIQFISPSSLGFGTYNDVVTAYFCHDPNCNKQIEGSPINIAVTLTVTEAIATPLVRLSRTDIHVEALTTHAAPTELIDVTISNPPAGGLYTNLDYATSDGIESASYNSLSADSGRIVIQLKDPETLGPGNYYDSLYFRACIDPNCSQWVDGGDQYIYVSYSITGPTPPDRELLPVETVQPLPHDVVDAEYSDALDAIVMVTTYPGNRLYLYDVQAGTEKSIALSKAPTAVSVSLDGLKAAVGHDALISIVDLGDLTQAGAPAPTLLNVSTDVLDIVLDGNGYVHAFPRRDQWEEIHSVHVATNTEYLSTGGFIYAGTLARLHPSGEFVYGISAFDLEKYDISGGQALHLYDSPYHGTYATCGNLWFSEDGASIYTACGNVFRASTVQSQDMLYGGSLALSQDEYYARTQIRWLSQSAEIKEIAAIEYDNYCSSSPPDCQSSHINFYESDFFNPVGSYSLPWMYVTGNSYGQEPLFFFHSADGTEKYLITRLQAMPNPDAEYYIEKLQ